MALTEEFAINDVGKVTNRIGLDVSSNLLNTDCKHILCLLQQNMI